MMLNGVFFVHVEVLKLNSCPSLSETALQLPDIKSPTLRAK